MALIISELQQKNELYKPIYILYVYISSKYFEGDKQRFVVLNGVKILIQICLQLDWRNIGIKY